MNEMGLSFLQWKGWKVSSAHPIGHKYHKKHNRYRAQGHKDSGYKWSQVAFDGKIQAYGIVGQRQEQAKANDPHARPAGTQECREFVQVFAL